MINLALNTTQARQDGIIIQAINMKRDLYRFAKARRYGERIQLAEGEWYLKYNNAIYKLNTTTNR